VYKEGGFFVAHYDDSYGHNGAIYRNRPQRSMTVLIYLNDDYEGGEIEFPRILDDAGRALRIKPRAGQAVCFPSHALFEHRVLPVTRGTRYNVSQWFDDAEWFRDYGALNPAFQRELNVFMAEQQWRFGHQTITPKVAGAPQYFDKVWADGPENVLNENRATQLAPYPALNRLWESLGTGICYGQSLIRCYANTTTHGLEPAVHKDSVERNYYTTLIYAVPEWKREWGGGTAFYNGTGTLHRLSECTPWRVVQFSGNTSHQALPIARECNALRTTLMFKARRIHEQHPDTRPTPDPFARG
jgi:Rps23 Pro-64 3,4-dihydroxylase Tpa1-like proline 4-hydroxylase